jgi:hypothetical protein
MSALESCPFCDYGSSGLHETGFIQEKNRTVGAYYPNLYRQECQKCGATGPTSISKEEMTEKWNHRPFEDKAIEVLVGQLIRMDRLVPENSVLDNVDEYRAEAKQLLGLDNNDKEK